MLRKPLLQNSMVWVEMVKEQKFSIRGSRAVWEGGGRGKRAEVRGRELHE